MGYNSGYEYFEGEDYSWVEYDAESNEAYETYVKLWGECNCLYKDDSGNWRKKNCNECEGC